MNGLVKDLEKLFPTEDVRKRFITMAILEFQLSIDDLENLLGIDKKTLYDEYIYDNGNIGITLKKMFDFNYEIPGVAKERFLAYFNRLRRAVKFGNEKLAKSILEELYDKEIVKFKQTHKPGESITDEEILAIVKYQIKYWLSVTQISELFNINQSNYIKRVHKLLDSYPILQEKYNILTDMYAKKHLNKP